MINRLFFYICLFLLGSSITSFYGVVIERREGNKNFIWGRSQCDFCGKNLSKISLIPFFHYFLLKGKSDCCSNPLSFKYPLSELVGGFIPMIIFTICRNDSEFIGYLLIYMALYYLVLWDCFKGYTYLIDHVIVFLIVGVSSYYFLDYFNFLGVILFGGIFLCISLLLPDKMGEGDGLFVGSMSIFEENLIVNYYSLTLGLVFGALYGISIMVKKDKKPFIKLPMYPFFFLGSFIHFIIKYCYN